MKLAINLDILAFVNPENPTVTARSITMRRDDILPIELVFYKDGSRFELGDDVTGSIQLNEKGAFGGSGLASDAAFMKSGSGVDSVYTFDLNLQGSAIDTAFTNASQPESINAALEVKITDGAHTQRTEPLAVSLQNAISQA